MLMPMSMVAHARARVRALARARARARARANARARDHPHRRAPDKTPELELCRCRSRARALRRSALRLIAAAAALSAALPAALPAAAPPSPTALAGIAAVRAARSGFHLHHSLPLRRLAHVALEQGLAVALVREIGVRARRVRVVIVLRDRDDDAEAASGRRRHWGSSWSLCAVSSEFDNERMAGRQLAGRGWAVQRAARRAHAAPSPSG